MLRSFMAGLLPNWLKRQAIREQRSKSSGSLAALESLQRRIRMADKNKPVARKPETAGLRSEKGDPDRKDTAGGPKAPKKSGSPVRDVREDPAPNPDGPAKGKAPMTPRPTDKPVTGA